MDENGKSLAKRAAAVAMVSGTLLAGGLATAGHASADTLHRSSVLTNVTPHVTHLQPLDTNSCCYNSGCTCPPPPPPK